MHAMARDHDHYLGVQHAHDHDRPMDMHLEQAHQERERVAGHDIATGTRHAARKDVGGHVPEDHKKAASQTEFPTGHHDADPLYLHMPVSDIGHDYLAFGAEAVGQYYNPEHELDDHYYRAASVQDHLKHAMDFGGHPGDVQFHQ